MLVFDENKTVLMKTRSLVYVCACVCMCVATVLIPLSPGVYVLALFMLFNGIATGSLDSGELRQRWVRYGTGM